MKRVAIFTAAAVGLAPVPAAAQDTIELDRASAWGLIVDKQSCALTRDFGPPEQRVSMEMRQHDPRGRFHFSFFSATIPVRPLEEISESGEVELTYLPETQPSYSGVPTAVASTNGEKGFTFTADIAPSSVLELDEEGDAAMGRSEKWRQLASSGKTEWESQVEAIRLGNAFTSDIVLRTGAMAGPVKAMRECMAQLLTTWGMDPAVQLSLSREPVRKDWEKAASAFMSRLAGPRAEWRWGGSSELILRHMIDETGKVTDCEVQGAIARDRFSVDVCKAAAGVMKYEPALDSSGNPVPSYDIWSVVFHAPQ